MKVYHGSNEKFDKFTLDEKLCKHDPQTILAEGIGVYMTEDMNVARSYGKYLYTIWIDDTWIADMTLLQGINSVIQRLAEDLYLVGVTLYDYVRQDALERWASGIIQGNYSCTEMDREIALLLDSEYSFYQDGNLLEVSEKALKDSMKSILQEYVLRYQDKTLGIIYICKNPELLQIQRIVDSSISDHRLIDNFED